MCPESRVAGVTGRSRFTRDPGARSPRLLRRKVSGERSAANESGLRSNGVRHTPLTAMLAPSVRSSSTAAQRIWRRLPAVTTVPSSSTIPVNIFLQPCFDGKFGRGNRVDADIAKADCVGAAAASDPAGYGERLHPAQNFRRVIKENFIRDLRFECGPVYAAAGFDHQRDIFFASQKIHHGAQICATFGVLQNFTT